MEIYLVGGAVRDELLGLAVSDCDWVVVGATPEEMLSLGYRAVGQDFPVFLHPKTHEEYALARTERKVSKGYTGFKFYADSSVTLEDDLKRRDLTINAIAKDSAGKFIDPYNGMADIKGKKLRHVSVAFVEDPVRILRVARFAARFADFTIAPETLGLMQQMVVSGEVDALVPERVWRELQRTLGLPHPERFFVVLQECGALAVLFPELVVKFLPALAAIKKAVALQQQDIIRFAALMSPLSSTAVTSISTRTKIPSRYQELAQLVSSYKNDFDKILAADAEQILTLLEHIDALRRPERFEEFLLTCEVCAKQDAMQQAQLLRQAYSVVAAVAVRPLLDRGLTGDDIKQELRILRLQALGSVG